MAKGIRLSIAADTKDFVKAVDNGIIEPLEDAAKVLETVGREGDQAGEKLERAMEDAQKETKDLAKEHRQLADTIKRESRAAGRDLDRNLGDATHSAKGNVQEFKREALQNFSEVTSSFDGSMSSVTDLAQGTFGGLAAGIAGPIGLAAGGAAVAVGLIGQAITEVGETSEENKAKAAEWASAYIEAGGKILSSAQIVAQAQDIITDSEKFDEAKTAAKDWGVNTSLAVLALAGDSAALIEVQDSLAIRTADANKKLAEQELQVTSDAGAVYDLADSVERGANTLKDLTGNMALGAQQADVFSESLRLTAENTAGAKKTVDEFGDAVYSLPDGTAIYIDAQTGRASQNVDDIEKKIFGIPSSKKVTVEVDLSNAERQMGDFFRTPRRVNFVELPKSSNNSLGGFKP